MIVVQGCGAVSPAGWGMAAFREALAAGAPLPTKALTRPGWENTLNVRAVPPANPRPAFLAHARLRRTSPISQYAVAAALEALGADAERVSRGEIRLGIVLCVMSGCVNYSRRFYDETLRDPATASPLVFPETVFNAPASHLAALLGTTAINYTLVGDPAIYPQGLAVAADWLLEGRVDGCLVIGAEELDWLTADAFRLFFRKMILADGAGALYLRRAESGTQRRTMLAAVTSPRIFTHASPRSAAIRRTRADLGETEGKLFDSLQGVTHADADEVAAWRDWPGKRFSAKTIMGEGLMAASAWQCVAAVDELQRGGCDSAVVSIAGCNEQAIGVRFAANGR